MVSIVKDNSDLDSWFSAKPIRVGNLSNILAGTELHLGQGVVNFTLLHILLKQNPGEILAGICV